MNTGIQRSKELCVVCGGELRRTSITHEERRGMSPYLFENVPAQVCTMCGEIWIEEITLQVIDQLIQEGAPIRTVETPVYDFACAGVNSLSGSLSILRET